MQVVTAANKSAAVVCHSNPYNKDIIAPLILHVYVYIWWP